MARTQSTLALAAVALCAVAGCSPESAYHQVMMVDGTASYAPSAAGLHVAGSFTLEIALDADRFASGDESEIYLQQVRLTQNYNDYTGYYGADDGADAALVSADVSLPYEASVGTLHRARFDWQVDLPAMDPAELCDYGLRSEVYLSLGDDLVHAWLEAKHSAYGYYYEAIAWTTDPCPGY